MGPVLNVERTTTLAGRAKQTGPSKRHLKCRHVLQHMWKEFSEQLTKMMKGW